MKMKMTLAVLLIMKLYCFSSGQIKHHFFINEKMTWNSASEYCKTHFHDLSTFTNESEEQRFLKDAANQPSDAWIGLYAESGVWKWSGGENVTQISWDINQPDKENGCAILCKVHKTPHNAPCTAKYAFFCMSISKLVLVHQKETWEGALEYCRTQNNDLASLSTINMMNSALPQITLAETEYVWTGLRFLAGHWFWINGDDLDYKTLYPTKLPQCPDGDLRCGALDKQTKLWTHRNCEEKFNFVCQ